MYEYITIYIYRYTVLHIHMLIYTYTITYTYMQIYKPYAKYAEYNFLYISFDICTCFLYMYLVIISAKYYKNVFLVQQLWKKSTENSILWTVYCKHCAATGTVPVYFRTSVRLINVLCTEYCTVIYVLSTIHCCGLYLNG